jgi:hypothetical protein
VPSLQEEAKPRITADDAGIHFHGSGRKDIVLHWGEIASVDAARCEATDGSTFLEIYVDHISGVDFRFDDVEDGYAQVMLAMEKHLNGFSRAEAEAARTWDQKQDAAVVWKRDESVQPFEIHPPEIDTRAPSDEELKQMDSGRQACVAACERKLGRHLTPAEIGCIYVGFENGRIVGNIRKPLCDLLLEREG